MTSLLDTTPDLPTGMVWRQNWPAGLSPVMVLSWGEPAEGWLPEALLGVYAPTDSPVTLSNSAGRTILVEIPEVYRSEAAVNFPVDLKVLGEVPHEE